MSWVAKTSFVVAFSSALACGLVACVSDVPSANDADSGTTSDASIDAGSIDGAIAPDSGRDAGPSCDAALPTSAVGVVQCVLDAGCSGGTPQCCYSNTGSASRCYTKGASCASDSFRCDKPSDCGGDTNVCCLAGTLGAVACPFAMPTAVGSVCRSTLDGGCGASEVELCSASESCLDGKKCQALVATVAATGGPFTRSLGGCF